MAGLRPGHPAYTGAEPMNRDARVKPGMTRGVPDNKQK
jgi:hypothetical protein